MGIEVELKSIKEKTEIIISWLKKKVFEADKKGVILGLSGGLDSAVVAVLCKKAFPENTLALILPCESFSSDIDDAKRMILKYQLNHKIIDLTSIYLQLLSAFEVKNKKNIKIANANLKPRLRMVSLYYYATVYDYLVVGTGNKSELMLGYFTKYGDGGVDLLPIGNLLKTEVKQIAQYLEIPSEIISKPPSAGLWEGQTDEKEMGFTYELLDKFISAGKIQDKDKMNKMNDMIKKSEHKRKIPPKAEI